MKPTTYYLAFAMLFLYAISYSQHTKLDSIVNTTSSISDSLNIDLAADLIYDLSLKEKFEEGLQYSDTIIRISQKIKYDKGVGKLYNEKANIYNQMDQLFDALLCYDQAFLYYGRVNHTRGLAITQNNKAVIEQRLGNSEKSLVHLLEAYSYYEKLKDSSKLATTINNIGNVYAHLKNFESAKKYYRQSLELKRKTGSNTIGSTLHNIAIIYVKENKLDSALAFSNESLEVNKKENYSYGIAESYNALGRISFIKKDYQKAKKYYESALFIGGKVAYKERLIRTKLSLAEIAIKTEKFEEAENYISSAKEESKKMNSTPLLLNTYDLYSVLDSARGDYLNAYKWQKQYKDLYQKHTLKETTQQIDIVKSRLENEKKQQASLDKQKREKQEAKEELFKQKIYTYVAIAAFIVAFIFIIGIIKARIQRAKYIKELNQSNQVKNKLFSIVSHDLKNEIHGLDKTLNLLKEDVISETEFKEIIPVLSNSTHQTSILLNNLLNWSKSQMKELKASPKDFDFTEVINDKIVFFTSRASQKGVKLINNLTDFTKVFADKDMCTIVAQNLIANAIKFCKSGDTLTIHKEEEKDIMRIYFRDTGIGIPKENLSKLFSDITLTTKGTDNESGTGLGLKICKELISLNHGTLEVKSILGQGSTFCIQLPKNNIL
ncbi:tetratricopeptide repeat-containing sensor histidine kinase [Aquimarina litoralis]|uniref:ATP-binding protein n=1 Tax=Aquimarina litoralis TaxID=584605 RepID=UPI001C5A2936|nr:tetratricopeptide repeat-containing sensor histidine kinase [Aquimarina litoralis]MBW1296930.1 tetratricopeptide repeat protein [Aquimarina litoralis]